MNLQVGDGSEFGFLIDGFLGFALLRSIFIFAYLQARDWLLFRQKPAKPLLPIRWPTASRLFLVLFGAAQLALIKSISAQTTARLIRIKPEINGSV